VEANEEENAARRALDDDAIRLSDGYCRMLTHGGKCGRRYWQGRTT
jgi:hypothetical protein